MLKDLDEGVPRNRRNACRIRDKQGDLRDHVRYPEDLFKIQRTLLARYHVKDPQAFFQGSQFWSVPADPTNEQADRQGLDQPPYYFVAAGPDDKRPSFQLTSVMTRLNRPILGAYMTASSDPEDYGGSRCGPCR